MYNRKKKWGEPRGHSILLCPAGIAVTVILALISRLRGAGFLLYLGLLAGAALTIYGFLGLMLQNGKMPRAALFLRRCEQILFILFLASFLLIEGLVIHSAYAGADDRAGAAVLFGAGLDGSRPSAVLYSRIGAAQDWLEDNPGAVIVVSGGQGDGENMTEAQAMYDELVSRGIEPGRIYREEAAQDTEQNVLYSRQILTDLGYSGKVALITSEFHLFRVGFLARRTGWETAGVPAQTPYLYLTITYFLREYFSVMASLAGL